MANPNIVLTGTFIDTENNAVNGGTLTIALVNYGSNLPMIAGTAILATVSQTVTISSSTNTFSVTLFGNDQISPVGTFYQITFPTGGLNSTIKNYSLTGTGTFDLSNLTPLNTPITPPISPGQTLVSPFTAVANTFITGMTTSGSFTSTSLTTLPLVGSATLSGVATSVTAISPNTYTTLLGIARLTFYGSSDTISLQFGNSATAVDTGNNYNWRYLAAAAGGTTFADTNAATTNLIRLAESGTTLSRTIVFTISNTSNKTKLVCVHPLTETANVGTLPSIVIGGGQWFNTAGQIGCFKALTAGGATFGGSIAFYGSN